MHTFTDPAAMPPFEVIAPSEQRLPLVFNSPHSGCCYPPAFLAASRLGDFETLVSLLDPDAVLRGVRIRVERHGREAGDEHDLQVGIELGRPAGKLDAVHLRHDDIGEEECERLLANALVGAQAIVEGDDVIAGVLKRFGEEATHVVVVLGEKNS